MEDPRLTLCMIVKDEEACLTRCLESVQGVVDEMIIVDTGSSDQTVAICEQYGATVLHYEWHDDFSAARNHGLPHATGDWILWLDADEALDTYDAAYVKELLREEEDHVLSVHLINYVNDTRNADDAFHIAQTRLFRNGKGLQFQATIHESLNITEALSPEELPTAIKLLPVRIHHEGYTESVIANKKKSERNLNLLLKELGKDGHSPWIEYHLASEYAHLQEYESAFAYVNRSIKGFLEQGIAPPSLLYKLKYSVLISTGSAEGAWPGIEKAIEMYPDYVDLHLYKGIILYLKGWYEQAHEAFDHCLEMGEGNLAHLTLRGSGSFHAWYYKGQCYEQEGRLEEALHAYYQSLSLSYTYTPASDALMRLNERLEA